VNAASGLPWYRHFWPWFVVGLLGISVVGSLTTVYIAVSGRDPLVPDPWSEDAKAVTRDDAPERLASTLGLRAEVVSLETSPAIEARLSGPAPALPDAIEISLVHPTLEARDATITAERVGAGVYRAALAEPVSGRYRLSIEGEARGDGGRWRMGDRVDLVPGRPVRLGAAPDAAASRAG
jgi:hypothetical protein